MIVGNRSCGGAEHSGRVLVQPVLPQCSMAGPGRKLSHRTWQRHAAVPKRPNIQSHAFREWFTSFVQPTNPTNSAPAAKITPKRDFLEARSAAAALAMGTYAGTNTGMVCAGMAPWTACRVCMPCVACMHRQVALYQLFDNQEYKFDVPAYQRPYSWGTKQVYEMLQVKHGALTCAVWGHGDAAGILIVLLCVHEGQCTGVCTQHAVSSCTEVNMAWFVAFAPVCLACT